MNSLKEMTAAMNSACRTIAISRNNLLLANRAEKADIAAFLKTLSGDYDKVTHTNVVLSNVGAVNKKNPLDTDFKVVAVFGNNSGASRYVAFERQQTPDTTFRILELFEGKFSSFLEYASVEAIEAVEA